MVVLVCINENIYNVIMKLLKYFVLKPTRSNYKAYCFLKQENKLSVTLFFIISSKKVPLVSQTGRSIDL